MGYTKHLQRRDDERRREGEELLSELAVLEPARPDSGSV
jgi:hypothetical protein